MPRLFLALLFIALALESTARAQTVGIATSGAGSFFHTQGSVIGSIVSAKSDLQARVQPFSSGNVHLPLINDGKIEFGLVSIYEPLLALEGKEFYQGHKNPNLRLVTVTSVITAAFFTRKDSDINTVADLKGKRVSWGYSQQNIFVPLLHAQFDAVGLTEKDITPVLVPTVVRGVDDFMAGRNDAFFIALGAAKVTEADAAVGGVKAVALPDTPETRASFKKNFPPAYIHIFEPKRGLTGILKPTPVMTYDCVMVVNANVPDDVVYKMTKALYENADEITKGSPTLAAFSRATMAKVTDPLQYHPGAIKFYKEKGLWPPKPN